MLMRSLGGWPSARSPAWQIAGHRASLASEPQRAADHGGAEQRSGDQPCGYREQCAGEVPRRHGLCRRGRMCGRRACWPSRRPTRFNRDYGAARVRNYRKRRQTIARAVIASEMPATTQRRRLRHRVDQRLEAARHSEPFASNPNIGETLMQHRFLFASALADGAKFQWEGAVDLRLPEPGESGRQRCRAPSLGGDPNLDCVRRRAGNEIDHAACSVCSCGGSGSVTASCAAIRRRCASRDLGMPIARQLCTVDVGASIFSATLLVPPSASMT